MQIDTKDLLLIVGTLSSILISVLTAWAQFRRIPSENAQSDANAAKSYAEAAEKVSEDNISLRKDIDALRKEVSDLRKELDKRDQIIQKLEGEKYDLKDWAERLVYQLKSHDLTPVPFRSSVAPSKNS